MKSNVDKLMLERAIKATISKLSLSFELPSGTSGLLTQLNSKEERLTTLTSVCPYFILVLQLDHASGKAILLLRSPPFFYLLYHPCFMNCSPVPGPNILNIFLVAQDLFIPFSFCLRVDRSGDQIRCSLLSVKRLLDSYYYSYY